MSFTKLAILQTEYKYKKEMEINLQGFCIIDLEIGTRALNRATFNFCIKNGVVIIQMTISETLTETLNLSIVDQF